MATSKSGGDYDRVRALYGDSILFDVYRDGTRVGSQRVDFEEKDGALAVDINFQLVIKALYITFYKMNYSSDSLWKDGQLVSLSSRTDQNGKVRTVTASLKDGKLVGKGPEGPLSAPLGTYPTDHWNAGVIGSKELVNTINGRVNEVRLVPKGYEQVSTERGPVRAMRYQYEGEIQNEVWYDAEGRWVHMRFLGEDGSVIEFKCAKCFPAAKGSAS
tara:strand:+ start:311209 stop:311856 length:648 start_codon:yes stop_codon:yes gene_type:complete